MSFTAQELNTPIELQRAESVQDEAGQMVDTWATYATEYAKVEPLVGREYFAAASSFDRVPVKVTIRWRPDVTPRDRLVIDGEAFAVDSVQNIKMRNRELLLFATRVPIQ